MVTAGKNKKSTLHASANQMQVSAPSVVTVILYYVVIYLLAVSEAA